MPIPEELKAQAEEWRDKLMDHVAEASDELMERYLEGDADLRRRAARRLQGARGPGQLFPVACGSATKNIGARGLLDLIVDGLPSPVLAGPRSTPTTRPTTTW